MKKAIIIIRLYYGYPFLLLFPSLFFESRNDHFAKTGSGQTLWKLMKSLSLSDYYGYYHGYSFLCYRSRARKWLLPPPRCFPAASERARGNSRLRHALTLFLSRRASFRFCALCLVERPQNADCSDETGVVMPAPPPPPAATVRSRARVCI